MDIQTVTREAASIANVLSVVVLAVGYYFMVRLYREWISLRQETRVAGGRPQVVVAANYSRVPEVYVVVRNFTEAPAKDITFDFSAPVKDSSGFVLSEMPYFEKGLPFLEPGGEISCHWDSLTALIPMLKKDGLEDGIRVTTRYKDLAGESYQTEWTLDPLLFEGARIEGSKGMNDLVSAVEGIASGDPGEMSRPEGAPRRQRP